MLWPTFTGSRLESYAEEAAQTFLEERKPEQKHSELLADLQAYNQRIYAEKQSSLVDLEACEESAADLIAYGIEDEIIGVLEIPAMELTMPVYGVSSCDIQRFFRDIWECSHRLKDVALENKDFESIITTHNDPQTTVYCDPPYYEAERYAVEFPRSDHQRLHDVLAQHTGFAMVSYNNCDYIRRLYEDFFIYEVERPNSQSKKKNDIYREYIMTNYDPRVFASQMTIFGDYSSDWKICRLVHIPERPLRT